MSATATLTRTRRNERTALRPQARSRDLLEFVRPIPAKGQGPALKVDRDKGIIYGVRVLGRYSKNTYDDPKAEGTEYSRQAMESARDLYENSDVNADHPRDRDRPGVERTCDDAFGKLRNVRIETDANGDPCVIADLYYLKSHELAESVLEDVERRLGIFGLSHNARSNEEHFDTANRRIVIDNIEKVRSVDLVRRAATNRNLWESEQAEKTRRIDSGSKNGSKKMATATRKKITFKNLIESQYRRFSAVRMSWPRRLLEEMTTDDKPMKKALTEDEMEMPMDDTGSAEAEPDDQLWAGFQQAMIAVLDCYKNGECDGPTAARKIAKFIKAHEKLTSEDEPVDVEESDEWDDEGEPDDKSGGKPKKRDTEESVKERTELENLRRDKKTRELAESVGVTLSEIQVEGGRSFDGTRLKEYVEGFKPSGYRAPRSASPHGTQPPAPAKKKPAGSRDLAESEFDIDAFLDVANRYSPGVHTGSH